MTSSPIPNKLFFKIGDVAKIVGVEPHVLRYWEAEFKILKPEKNQAGQRVYRRKDVEKVLEIKNLLHGERYSIEGARKKLRQKRGVEQKEEGPRETLTSIKNDLKEILNILDKEEP